MRNWRCGVCFATGGSRVLNFVGKFPSKALFSTLFASKSASSSRLTVANTHHPRVTKQGKQSWWRKVFESSATGTTTCCNNLPPCWRTFSQSSPSRKNPSPVAELRSAPPSPTRGEGKKERPPSRHDPLPHPTPLPHALPQLSRGERAGAGGCRGAGGAERRRQDQLPGGDLVSVAGTRPAARDAGGCRRQPGRRFMGGIGRGRGRVGACHARHRYRCARRGGGVNQPALPDRPRARELGNRLRRSLAHGVADARDGRAVSRRGVRTAALLRPAGAGDRQRTFQPRLGAGALVALAQSPARSAQL